MKNYFKPFKARRVTVESMLTCAQKCMVHCDCSRSCGTSVINGAAIEAAPSVNGTTDPVLVATGSVYG